MNPVSKEIARRLGGLAAVVGMAAASALAASAVGPFAGGVFFALALAVYLLVFGVAATARLAGPQTLVGVLAAAAALGLLAPVTPWRDDLHAVLQFIAPVGVVLAALLLLGGRATPMNLGR